MPFPFDNSYVRLPADFFSKTDATPVSAPQWIMLNRELAKDLRLDLALLDSSTGLAYLSGNQNPLGAEPLAMAYAGHQFGGFSPQLGDGRAILLGEVLDKNGRRYDIQLKGAGPTAYSRRGDGRSALGPVLREYLLSEAMTALGVPSTRALAAVWSGDQVRREAYEPGGVFTRVASSHMRVGTFQYFAAKQDHENIRLLADYAMDRHYPEARERQNAYLGLLDGVIRNQAQLIARWMQVGFIHGVLNTDNMSISGETIDYGPCAFLDDYDPAKKFSYIDQQGRYAYENQPAIAHWNLTRLAETLLPLLGDKEEDAIEAAKSALGRYSDIFQSALVAGFCAKVGIKDAEEADWLMVQSLLELMKFGRVDFTLTFRYLLQAASGDEARFTGLFKDLAAIGDWLERWRARLAKNEGGTDSGLALMRKVNPVFIPRNHRIEEVIQAGIKQDFEPFHRLLKILQNPFSEQCKLAEYENPPQPDEVVQATFCGT